MSTILPKDSGGDFELCPAGTFIATCYRVIDLGTQQIEWQGKVKRQKKIMLSWELTTEKMKDGRPFSIHKRYTLSSSDKATLRIDLESWRGVAFKDEDFGKFDIAVLLGKSCLMGIVHDHKDSKTYSNISSLLRLPKGVEADSLVNAPVKFSLSEFDQEIYDSFGDGLKATIAKSPEYQELKGGHKTEPNTAEDGREFAPANATFDDEIPF
jgi:hypothetical protein